MNAFAPVLPVSSAALFERASQSAPGGVHSPVRAFKDVDRHPIFMKEAEGVYLTDVSGRRYLDFCMSWGPLILGHRHPRVEEALSKALRRGWTLGTADPYSLELVELVCDHLPWVESLRLVNSGTEAVMSALRLARAATGRTKLLKFAGCYHGHVDSMLVAAGSGLASESCADSAGLPSGTTHQTIVASLDDEVALEQIFADHGGELAAVTIEPLPANHGLLPQRAAFLRKLSTLTTQHGALLIFDEVISGFRIGFGGMAERLGITPDLVTYGKILGGGLPCGGYGGKRELMNLVAPVGPVYQAGTLSGNPLAVAAGVATLRHLLVEPPYDYLASLSGQLVAALSNSNIVRVQRESSLFWIHHQSASPQMLDTARSPDQISDDHAIGFKQCFNELLNRGLYTAPSAFEVGFLSAAHQPTHVDQLADQLLRALAMSH